MFTQENSAIAAKPHDAYVQAFAYVTVKWQYFRSSTVMSHLNHFHSFIPACKLRAMCTQVTARYGCLTYNDQIRQRGIYGRGMFYVDLAQ